MTVRCDTIYPVAIDTSIPTGYIEYISKGNATRPRVTGLTTRTGHRGKLPERTGLAPMQNPARVFEAQAGL